jgi:hypothetical protein
VKSPFADVSKARGPHGLTRRQATAWPLAVCGLSLWLASGAWWGDTTGGTATVTAGPYIFFQLPQSVTIYGLIPALQNATAGPYTDTIMATVTF